MAASAHELSGHLGLRVLSYTFALEAYQIRCPSGLHRLGAPQAGNDNLRYLTSSKSRDYPAADRKGPSCA